MFRNATVAVSTFLVDERGGHVGDHCEQRKIVANETVGRFSLLFALYRRWKVTGQRTQISVLFAQVAARAEVRETLRSILSADSQPVELTMAFFSRVRYCRIREASASRSSATNNVADAIEAGGVTWQTKPHQLG